MINQIRLIHYITDRRRYHSRWEGALTRNRQVPIALINGPFDPVSGRHLAEHYIQQITAENVTILNENIGHYPQWEDPEAVLTSYYAFVKPLLK